MERFSYQIQNPIGIHARPAGMLVKAASQYRSEVMLQAGEKSANAKKIFSVLTLGAKCGDQVEVSVQGEDEQEACADLKAFFEENL